MTLAVYGWTILGGNIHGGLTIAAGVATDAAKVSSEGSAWWRGSVLASDKGTIGACFSRLLPRLVAANIHKGNIFVRDVQFIAVSL